jgi:hypothetical protein
MKILKGDPEDNEIGTGKVTLVFDIETDTKDLDETASQVRGKWAELIAAIHLTKKLKKSNRFLKVELKNESDREKRYQSIKQELSSLSPEEKRAYRTGIEGGILQADEIAKILVEMKDTQVTSLIIDWSGEDAAKGDSGTRGDLIVECTTASEESVKKLFDISLKATELNIPTPPLSIFSTISFIKTGRGSNFSFPSPKRLEKQVSSDQIESTLDGYEKALEEAKKEVPELSNYCNALLEYIKESEEIVAKAKSLEAAATSALQKKHSNFVKIIRQINSPRPEEGIYFLKPFGEFVEDVIGKEGRDEIMVKVTSVLFSDLKNLFQDREMRLGIITNRLGTDLASDKKSEVVKLAVAANFNIKKGKRRKRIVSNTYDPSTNFSKAIQDWVDGKKISYKETPSVLNVYLDGEKFMYFSTRRMSGVETTGIQALWYPSLLGTHS